jgi:hypothetical protein
MATTTRNDTINGNWEPIDFLLISNASQTNIEFWAGPTAPTENNIGHPITPNGGLNYNVFEDDTVTVYFRSRSLSATVTITEVI